MGLFDIFSSKEKRDSNSREKNIQKANDKYRQSPDRLRALELLIQDGSDDALVGVLRRFTMTYDKSIEDEQEKQWMYETLVAMGPDITPAILRSLLTSESVSWPLRVLAKISPNKDAELDTLAKVLAKHPPGYERDPTKKVQVLTRICAIDNPRCAAMLTPYLEDMDEGVRIAAAEGLVMRGKEDEIAGTLVNIFVSQEEESHRLRRVIAEGFANRGWSLGDRAQEASAKVPSGMTIDKKGFFVKRAG